MISVVFPLLGHFMLLDSSAVKLVQPILPMYVL